MTAAAASAHQQRQRRQQGPCRQDSEARPPCVSLTTYASFASRWLVPRLAAFQQRHPQIEIRIDASDRQVELQAEGVDLAIRHCRPPQVAGLPGVTQLLAAMPCA